MAMAMEYMQRYPKYVQRRRTGEKRDSSSSQWIGKAHIGIHQRARTYLGFPHTLLLPRRAALLVVDTVTNPWKTSSHTAANSPEEACDSLDAERPGLSEILSVGSSRLDFGSASDADVPVRNHYLPL